METNAHIAIASGGTGGHIFPALAVARELQRQYPNVSLLWIGTNRSREKEVCENNGIPLELVDVTGFERKIGLKALRAMGQFGREVLRVRRIFSKRKPDAVLAFGGYVCAPVLTAASTMGIPYFLQEQNSVPGMVNRMFASGAREIFLGMPLALGKRLRGSTIVTGNPVRQARSEGYDDFEYPQGLERKKRAVFICGGSQGAQSMNRHLVSPVKKWLQEGTQVIWQTGKASYDEVRTELNEHENAHVFVSIEDPYPYYAAANVVLGRAGASTLAEIAYFGLPCVLIPLPWAAEDHQWTNAAWAEAGGWAIRVAQDETTGQEVDKAVRRIIDNPECAEQMSKKALNSNPAYAAEGIAQAVMKEWDK